MAEERRAGAPRSTCSATGRFSIDLLVDARALIPRPETELLAELALVGSRLAARRDRLRPRVRDGRDRAQPRPRGAVRTGLVVEVHATDTDAGALEPRGGERRPRRRPGLQAHRGSWYEALPVALRGRVDVCCSNPPYVSVVERRGSRGKLDFEPEVALVADDGADGTPGFAAIEAVVAGAPGWLAPGGILLVEHADTHRDAAVSLARRCGLADVTDHDDLAGRPRVLQASMPS